MPPTKAPLRVLVLSAEEGEGHRSVARAITADLLAASDAVEVSDRDIHEGLGRLVPFLARDVYKVQLSRWLAWTYGLECLVFARFGPGRALARFGLALLGGRPMLRLIRSERPDVIVSTHPAGTSVVGTLRRRGKLAVPCVATVSDLGVHPLWAHRAMDLHLVMHESCIEPVERIAGEGSAVVSKPLVAPEFRLPRPRAEARASLDLPAGDAVVVVSGGGWGVGALDSGVRAALGVEGAFVVCVCGHNDAARERLEELFADEPRLRVLGFTERMNDLIAAADAIVHSTGGVTTLEALVRGCPVVAFGAPPGHARWNADALEALGFGESARTPAELTAALRRAIDRPRPLSEPLGAGVAPAALVLRAASGPRPVAQPRRRARFRRGKQTATDAAQA